MHFVFDFIADLMIIAILACIVFGSAMLGYQNYGYYGFCGAFVALAVLFKVAVNATSR